MAKATFTEEEIEHLMCSEQSKGVVWSYVVEKDGGKITDFVSYYLLEVRQREKREKSHIKTED